MRVKVSFLLEAVTNSSQMFGSYEKAKLLSTAGDIEDTDITSDVQHMVCKSEKTLGLSHLSTIFPHMSSL